MDSVGIPRSTRDFRGAPAGRRNRQVWKKFILSSGFADPVTAGHERCIYAYAPDADKGLLTPSCLHPHMETRSRLLHGRCSTLPLFLSLSLSRFLFHFSPLFLSVSPFPSLSLSFSRFLLFSLLLCQSARFRTAKEYLKRCIFRIISIHPHRIHPAQGSIIHCTAR